MRRDKLIADNKNEITVELDTFRPFLEGAIGDGWLPPHVLTFFDDAKDLHVERERFTTAGDGIDAVVSELQDNEHYAPSTVRINERIEKLQQIKVAMYTLGENASPV